MSHKYYCECLNDTKRGQREVVTEGGTTRLRPLRTSRLYLNTPIKGRKIA